MRPPPHDAGPLRLRSGSRTGRRGAARPHPSGNDSGRCGLPAVRGVRWRVVPRRGAHGDRVSRAGDKLADSAEVAASLDPIARTCGGIEPTIIAPLLRWAWQRDFRSDLHSATVTATAQAISGRRPWRDVRGM